MSRPPRGLALVRALAPAAALACFVLPFYGLAGTHPSPESLTGFEVLALSPSGAPGPGPVAALLVGSATTALLNLGRPSVLMVLMGLLATVSAAAAVVQGQSSLQAVAPGQDLPGYWLSVSLLVVTVLASLAELLHTDVGREFGGEDGEGPVRD
ncbi:hypothetical protein [Nocardiopsis kunsanensis]|uniref:Uncharacterized protein n=1 Tax=Nocardiopsis kunsanensis TaxID=141693 RepID=A0A918X8Z4_9ACTN|nr:hypothetical protein [Nocardiopsis kunsanensis]GHD18801.1 hypothetical protein GCM10007147_09350 [Nocardiopsis kunsanensis]